ncbi:MULTISPECIES: GPW/gp25 family protein [Dickeya]|uniref:GPW/gp25 family protein n=1 Tax=Dickeya solani TaxID=1089444 RepID=A0ABU4EE86_9GAMM|nr:GPW/gp25 family protein [Dickeya solani]MCA7001644.1 GPW/gp25 family protein [Dickeya solani]MCZ0821070.1 GPW/gp25 family protein [Dickeya solani]MDV6997445.1 GPW/gp25 family protein [Dickeya solani]MDV7003057.1 GPW/gp25 family protein [Dickeya solani]MDV7040251.1 GPW/gp25 family protein [Dickeya solani]
MNTRTGAAIADVEHIRQSIIDILTTPEGSRLMRRDYGSRLFSLIDQPFNEVLRLRMISAVYSALMRWEPRIVPTRIELGVPAAGRATMTIAGRRTDSDALFSAEVTL